MMDRRNFIKTSAAASSAALAAAPPPQTASSRMIGIQVGAISFLDEGVEKVLDIFQERASVNTLFLAVFTYGRGIAGRQVPGQPLPDTASRSTISTSTAAISPLRIPNITRTPR